MSDMRCGKCGRDDQVQAVSAIYDAGRTSTAGSYRGMGAGAGIGGGAGRLRGGIGASRHMGFYQATSRTELAASIAPAPQTTSAEIIFVMFLTEFGAAIMVLLAVLVARTASGLLLLLLGVVVLVVVGWQIVRAFRIRSLVRAGLPTVTPLWRTGYYCFRCGVVTMESQVYEPQEFRQEVWNKGGYGHVRAK